MFHTKFLFQFGYLFFHQLFHHSLSSYFPLQLLNNFFLSIGNHPFHHLVLLLNFLLLQPLNFPKFLPLPAEAMLHLHPLLSHQLTSLLLLPQQFQTHLLDLRVHMFDGLPLRFFLLHQNLLQ